MTTTVEGVVSEGTTPVEELGLPDFNYRADCLGIAPWFSTMALILLSLALSGLFGSLLSILVWGIGLAVGWGVDALKWVPFDTWAMHAGWLVAIIWPFICFGFYTLIFSPDGHVTSGPGHILTIEIAGGRQLGGWEKKRWLIKRGIYLKTGSHPGWTKVKYFRFWKHAVGGNSVDMLCAGAIPVKSKDGKSRIFLTSRNGGPARTTWAWLPLNLFQNARRADQEGPEIIHSNTQDVASAFISRAITGRVTIEDILGDTNLDQTVAKSLEYIEGDEGEHKVVRVWINGKWQRVLDLENGIGIYNPHATDIGPSPEVQKAYDGKTIRVQETEGQAQALEIATAAVVAAGPNFENAAIMSGVLSGEEVSIKRQDFKFSVPGVSGPELVELSRNLAAAAPGLVALGEKKGGQDRRQGRQNRHRKGQHGGNRPPQKP